MNENQKYNAEFRIPEEMTVGELNQAVRDLRELLYQTQLQLQTQKDQNWKYE